MSSSADRAQSFGAEAARYDRVRPSYPPEAVAFVLPAGAVGVVDVGAGTGKLTAALVGRGLQVVAVEPDGDMRAVLADSVPSADLRNGTAEQLPVDDCAADAVVFGQSWHWAEPASAAAEAARVLRPGGSLGLLWNMDDDTVDWVAKLGRLTGSSGNVTAFEEPGPIIGFCAGHRRDVVWRHCLDRGDLLDLVSTWSLVSTLPQGDRQGVLDEVARLVQTDPAIADADRVELPRVCVALSYHLT